jgi:hypothetical protein
MRSLGFLLTVALVGCAAREHDEWGYVPDLAAPVAQDAGAPPSPGDGGAALLGSGRAQPAATTARHILANASIDIPPGQVGFAITADGQGGYRVAWVDTAGANRRYHGSVFVAGSFSQLSSVGMQYVMATGERLDFQSAPGAGTTGYVDFVTSVDPITVDGLVGSSDATLFYVDGSGVARSVATPATLTSP